MCSEELRSDLESFINKGLNKGLRGWPVKVPECLPACRFRPKNIASPARDALRRPQLYVGGYSTPRPHGPLVGMNLGAYGLAGVQGRSYLTPGTNLGACGFVGVQG